MVWLNAPAVRQCPTRQQLASLAYEPPYVSAASRLKYGGPVGRALRHLRDALIEVCTAHFLRFALAPRTNRGLHHALIEVCTTH